MPNIDSIDSIKINVYNGDHRSPHIHAIYNEYEILIEIETGYVFPSQYIFKDFIEYFYNLKHLIYRVG